MKKLVLTFIVTIVTLSWLFLPPHVSHGQQVEAPVYRDGDWWKVKVDVSLTGGLSRSGFCQEMYSEYVVKIDKGKPKVYGVEASKQEEINCPIIAVQLLGLGPVGQKPASEVETESASEDESQSEPVYLDYLRFPLSVGRSWSDRVAERRRTMRGTQTRWIDVEFKPMSLEKVQTSKGEFEALKIEISGWPKRVVTYHYSQKAKAIVRLESKRENRSRTVELTDFNVSP